MRSRVADHYAPLNPVIDQLDGISMKFDDWRFNLRSSNTEPLLRLNLGTRGDRGLMERKTAEVPDLIRGARP